MPLPSQFGARLRSASRPISIFLLRRSFWKNSSLGGTPASSGLFAICSSSSRTSSPITIFSCHRVSPTQRDALRYPLVVNPLPAWSMARSSINAPVPSNTFSIPGSPYPALRISKPMLKLVLRHRSETEILPLGVSDEISKFFLSDTSHRVAALPSSSPSITFATTGRPRRSMSPTWLLINSMLATLEAAMRDSMVEGLSCFALG